MSEIASAFSAFGKKLSRFVQSDETAPNLPPRTDELTQRRILEADAAFSAAVVKTYAKYRFPYQVFGEHSHEARSIARDEDALLAAYRLFCAVREANDQFGTDQTRIKDDVIASPLAGKPAYTQGGDFVYLQCWLRYEQGVTDVVPQFAQGKEGLYTLQFVPSAAFRADYKTKEITAVIQDAFYQ